MEVTAKKYGVSVSFRLKLVFFWVKLNANTFGF
jgi:hypothetical protein